ncbi:hypothetical protein N7450_007250, partial [Penicillium hetheringtonii]
SNRHPILGFNFVFWIIVYIVADSTFKRSRTAEEILAYNFTNLIQRECFKDQLYIYRICANVILEVIYSQIFDYQNYNIYIKYQSILKSLYIQILIYDLEPDYKYQNIEQNITHYGDPNISIKLDAVSIDIFENTDKIKIINQKNYLLISQILDQPLIY